jgi:plasmid stabilization system protein ParE
VRFEVSAEAAQDLRDIRAYLAASSPERAERVVGAIIERIEQIPEFPRAGVVAVDYAPARVRQLLVNDYRILYVVGAETVTVIAVIHVARAL